MSEQYDSVETEETEATGAPEADASAEETLDAAAEVEATADTEDVADEDSESSDVDVASDETPQDDDPLEAFRRELWAKPGDWFVVHTYSGMENRVKSNLENRIISLNMEDYIHEIVVPPRRSRRSRTASARWSSAPFSPVTCWSAWT